MKSKNIRAKSALAAIFLLGLFAYLLYHFNTSPNLDQSELDVTNIPGVQIEIIEASYTGATYSISNTSESTISFGYDFGIEILRGVKWFELPHSDMLTVSIQLELLPGQSESYTCSWESTYGTLSAGQYRLVKQINTYENWENLSHWVACEFILS